MAFPSSKTPEQLAFEAKQKNKYLADKAIKCMKQLAGKRSVDRNVKDHINGEILPLLEALAIGVGPSGG